MEEGEEKTRGRGGVQHRDWGKEVERGWEKGDEKREKTQDCVDVCFFFSTF